MPGQIYTIYTQFDQKFMPGRIYTIYTQFDQKFMLGRIRPVELGVNPLRLHCLLKAILSQ